jgi:hypothetical protein
MVMRTPDPLKFYDDEIRRWWIENALIHPNGPVKIILLCYDNLDAAYYPCNLLNNTHYVEKTQEIESQNEIVKVIEIIDVVNSVVYKLV